MTRLLQDITTKDPKIILVLDTPTEKDIKKGKLLSTTEGVSYNQVLKKSKFKNNIYYTYIDDSFLSYFLDILRNTTVIENSYMLDPLKAKKLKIVFSGKEV